MSIPSDIRIPLLPLSITRSNISIPSELMIDYIEGLLYYKSKNGKRNVLINRDNMISNVMNKIRDLYGDVSGEYNTLFKIREILRDIELWKQGLMLPDEDNIVDTIVELLDKFRDMSNDSETLKDKLNMKVNKLPGKGLSTVDFSDEYLDKLNNIENEANKYIHPSLKECNYQPDVQSVNGKTGIVEIKPIDLGLQNLDPNAIKYEHPMDKQCTAKVVISVNNKTGAVTLSKNDFDLDNINNNQIAYGSSLLSSNFATNNNYLSPNGLFNIFNEYIHSSNLFVNKYLGIAKGLITGTELSNLCGLSSAGILNTSGDINWSKFFYMGSIIYYSNSIIRTNVPFSSLNDAGCFEGKIITIGGKRYKCRLISSGAQSYVNVFYKGELFKLSKAEDFSNISSDMRRSGTGFWCSDIIQLPSNENIVCTSTIPIMTDVDFSNKNSILESKSTVNGVSGWRPVLELLDYIEETESEVNFITTPSDAVVKVLINGTWIQGKSHTLEIGRTYTYNVNKTGYISVNGYITPSSLNHDISVPLVLEPPKQYTLTINTTPSDATVKVFYNSKWNTGKIHYLTNGVYSVEISRSGYTTMTTTVTISNSNKTEDINLSLIKYTLTINTTPSDATVKVFYNSKWNTGKIHYLTNGVYNIEVSSDGYITKSVYVYINNNDLLEDIKLSGDDQYLGKVNNIITGESLLDILDLSYMKDLYQYKVHRGDITWLKFKTRDNKVLLVADRNIAVNVSHYSDLFYTAKVTRNQSPGVHNNLDGRNIKIGSKYYNCRLLTGSDSNYPSTFGGGEWDRLLTRFTPDNSDSNWLNSPSWCQEVATSNPWLYIVIRGGQQVNSVGSGHHETRYSYVGFRPVLEEI